MAKLIDITGKALSGEWGKEDENGTGVPVLRTTNFTNDGIVNFTNVVTRDISKSGKSEKFLRKGDIIIEKSGGSDKQPVGRVIYFEGEENKYLFNNFTGLLRVHNQKKWDPKFVFYSLFANYRQGGTRSYENKTTGLHNLKLESYIQNTEIKDYAIEQQNCICTALDQLRQIIVLRKTEIEKLEELIKARFVEMFGDTVVNSKGWPVHRFSQHISFLTSGSRGWAKYFTDEGEYFITIKNVKNCRITIDEVQHINPPDNAEAKRTKVQEGDLLISITADLGRTGVVTKEIANHGAYINQHLTCIRMDHSILHPLYTAYFMESEAGKKQFQAKNQSAVKAGLNFNSINSLQIAVPPMLLQEKFASFVNQIDKSKVVVQKALDEAQLLFDSLMQQYFG